MKDDIYPNLLRYQEMVGLCSGSNRDDPEEADRDFALYGKEYGTETDADGNPIYSPAKIVRFVVEICGHSYNDALAAVVEDMQDGPIAPRIPLPKPDEEARKMRTHNRNIIEDLFNLKVVRLAREGDASSVRFAWDVTREVMAMESPERRANPAR